MRIKKKHVNYIFIFVCISMLGVVVSCSPGSVEPAAQQVDTPQQNEAYPGPLAQSIQSEIEQYENRRLKNVTSIWKTTRAVWLEVEALSKFRQCNILTEDNIFRMQSFDIFL